MQQKCFVIVLQLEGNESAPCFAVDGTEVYRIVLFRVVDVSIHKSPSK